MKSNNVIDLFCGCGGFSKGFEDAGFEIVLAIDSWKDAIDTFNKYIVRILYKDIKEHIKKVRSI